MLGIWVLAPALGAAPFPPERCTPVYDTLNRRKNCCAFWCTKWQAAWPAQNPDCAYCGKCRDDCDANLDDCVEHACELHYGLINAPPSPPPLRTVSSPPPAPPKTNPPIANQATDDAQVAKGELSDGAPVEAPAFGPLSGQVTNAPAAGMAVHYGMGSTERGAFTLKGNARAYLVRDHTRRTWAAHSYVRMDLNRAPLSMDVDLSRVPCGCLACVYLIAMPEPVLEDPSSSCDLRAAHKPECATAWTFS